MEKKRVVLAVALSAIIFFGWTLIMSKLQPKQNIKKVETSQNIEKPAETPSNKTPEKKPEKKVKSYLKLSKVETKEKFTEINTSIYKVKFSNKGAKIKSFKYGERDIEVAIDADEAKGIKGNFNFPIFFNDNEILNGNILDDSLWSLTKKDDKEIIFSIKSRIDSQPVVIEKIYTFNEKDYYFKLTYRVKNRGRKELSLPEQSIIIGTPDFLGPKIKNYTDQNNLLSSTYMINSKFVKADKISGGGFGCSSAPKTELPSVSGSVNWVGLYSRYFVTVLIPQGFTGNKVYWDARKNMSFRSAMGIDARSIKAGGEIEKSFKVCVAEKKKDLLESVDPSIVEATDTSKWIEPIRVIFMWVLLKIYKLIGNFGWAIVLMSILTKLLFLPLTQKSAESMKKMSALAPKMNELKVKYKDKPDVLQKETMKLYRENGVNPMGGCLPLVIQMPFFIALYSALGSSLDMWQAPFILWINDLSMPDTVATISGISVNVLPIIMVVTTFLQQKFSGMEAAQQQNKMMKFLPLIFLFFFWRMPSGLILYWIIQNILQVGHQLVVNKIKEKKKA